MMWFLLEQQATTADGGSVYSRASIPADVACLTSKALRADELPHALSDVFCVPSRPGVTLRVVGRTEDVSVLTDWIVAGRRP